MFVSVGWYALNWDCGLVNCVANILFGCWLFWQNKIQDYCWRSFIIVAWNRIRGERCRLAISFDCSVLKWDTSLVNGTNILHGCWLFWQNEIWGFCWRSFIIVARNSIRGEGWHLAISFDWSVLKRDRGLVTCGTNILCRWWLFGQNKIQVYCWMSFNIVARNRIRGRGEVLPFHLIAQCWSGIVVLSTVLSTSFTGVDSFNNTRFRFLLESSNTVVGIRNKGGGVKSCHFIWLLSVKLGLWCCQLWHQHPSHVLTLLRKWDSGLLLNIFQYYCKKQN